MNPVNLNIVASLYVGQRSQIVLDPYRSIQNILQIFRKLHVENRQRGRLSSTFFSVNGSSGCQKTTNFCGV